MRTQESTIRKIHKTRFHWNQLDQSFDHLLMALEKTPIPSAEKPVKTKKRKRRKKGEPRSAALKPAQTVRLD